MLVCSSHSSFRWTIFFPGDRNEEKLFESIAEVCVYESSGREGRLWYLILDLIPAVTIQLSHTYMLGIPLWSIVNSCIIVWTEKSDLFVYAPSFKSDLDLQLFYNDASNIFLHVCMYQKPLRYLMQITGDFYVIVRAIFTLLWFCWIKEYCRCMNLCLLFFGHGVVLCMLCLTTVYF